MNINRGGRWAALTGLLVLVLVACGQGTAPPNSVTKVTVSPATLQLSVGGTGTLTATVTTNGTADLGVTWSSADTGVATVNASGVVTGVAAGSTTITATSKHDASKKGTAQVTVTGGSTGEAPFLWNVSFGSDEDDAANGIAVDSLGNVILAGRTYGELDGVNLGGQDAFVGKFTSDGTEIWLVQFGTGEDDRLTSVVVDGNDDIYVAGETLGDLGGPNAGRSDAFLRKYTADGDVVWTEQFGTDASERGDDIAVDGDGNVFVNGMSWITGSSSGFVRKYQQASDGLSVAEQWTTTFEWGVRQIAVLEDGNVVGIGSAWNEDMRDEAYVFKLDADGDLVWESEFGTGRWFNSSKDRDEVPVTRRPVELWEALRGYSERAIGLAVDAAGNVFITGFAGAVPITARYGVEMAEPFVAKLTPDGTEEWAVLLEHDWDPAAFGVVLDSNGNVFVVGTTLMSYGPRSPPGTEVLAWKLSPQGDVLWKDVFGTSGEDVPTEVAAATDGSVYLTGYQFGELGLSNPAGSDVFLRKYGP